ncbi:hypothetical protein G3480_11450 [Thiorhodococcus mannitoliphagus]|uniref:Uncharacterized protein n=1 Tax=Thiorhodococcus mannitoliphagus TaxID=329406 RepID=A0A6P1DVB5_9GAMM|nr:hypothetical protein [Thiorhodococcus mannitoliphagus]NEX20921.1 hypothetical protein [Thiorhodococcus mannitoliphagus]
MNEAFLKPRLLGRRFAEHTIPLDLLKDFAALEVMLVEVAKHEYRTLNPDRSRVSKGFPKGLEFHLSGIEEGSTIPILTFVFSGLLPPADVLYFERAKDQIIEAIASVEQDCQPSLPPKLLRYFDRFGRGLREGEAIEFTRAQGQTTALTPAIRERLLRASQAEEWTEEVILKGRISEMDQADLSFELELRTGPKLKAPLDEQHRETVLQAFGDYRQGQIVAVQGVIRRDRADRPKSFESIEHISLLDPLDVETRLEELATLPAGWLDGKGEPLAPTTLRALAQDFDTYFDPDLPLPYLYPTAEGAVQAEWTLGDWEVSLEIELTARTAQYQALHIPTDQVDEQVFLSLQGQDAWSRLNALLKGLSEGTA